MGIAREASVIISRFGKKARFIEPKKTTTVHTKKDTFRFEVNVAQKNICKRVMAVVIDNVTITQSEDLIRKRLEMVGIRALNNVIDITNYVMTEIGHPTHVFDYDRIATRKLLLRTATKGEHVTTLDEKSYTLHGGEVIIEDGSGKIIDLPGIMGGVSSSVTNSTKRVLFFIENNDPILIRRSSMIHAIRTNAARLNEKGVDPELVSTALNRGIELMLQHTGGKVASKIYDWYPSPYTTKEVKVTKHKAFQYLGTEIPDKEIAAIFTSLGFKPSITKESITVGVPSYRSNDITIPEDLIEELARIYGYHNLPNVIPMGEIPSFEQPKQLVLEEKIKQALKYWGYTETYSYSFVSENLAKLSGFPPHQHVKLLNPLSQDWEYMRRSLIPSLLMLVGENQSRKDALFFFELSNIYVPTKKRLPYEHMMLVIVNQRSFLELKGIVEELLAELGINQVEVSEEVHELLHPYQTGVITHTKKVLGYIGTVHPKLMAAFDIKKPAFVAELNIQTLTAGATSTKHFVPIPTHPAVTEDFSFILPERIYVGEVLQTINTLNPLITSVELLNHYQTTRTFRITFQDPKRNLTKEDIDLVRKKLIQMMERKFKGRLKK